MCDDDYPIPDMFEGEDREELDRLRAALAEAERERDAQRDEAGYAIDRAERAEAILAETHKTISDFADERARAERAEADLAAMKAYALKLDDWNDTLQADLAAAQDMLDDTRRIHVDCCGKSAMERDKAVADLADAKDDYLRLHTDKMVLFEANLVLKADIAAARATLQSIENHELRDHEDYEAIQDIARAFLERTAAEPVFRPCVVQWDEIGATEMVLDDKLIVYRPWGPFKGHAVDLGYNEAGKLVAIKIWDRVAERTAAASDPPSETKKGPVDP